MDVPEPFVDVHCHLLPGLDDGARGWDEALEMARLAAADGIRLVVATPHQLGRFRGNTAAVVRQRVRQLQAQFDRQDIAVRVLPGADVRVEHDLVERLRADDVLTLGDHGRHVLLELPHELYLPLESLLQELAAFGIVGILSHPERNGGIQEDPAIVARLVAAGCLMQLTADSLLGAFGRRSQVLSEQLLQQGLSHFVSSDAHGARKRLPVLRRAYDRVRGLVGEPTAIELFCRNPGHVAAGRDVPLEPRKNTRRRFPHIWKSLVAS